MVAQMTARGGSRWSTAKAFVQPALGRPNFDLSMGSLVTQIGLEAGHPEPIARTVHYIKDNEEYTVRAKKEIVVSCGTVKSPQLLMLSGIGPEEHLNELGIKVWKNLPVGYNFQDHVGPIVFTFVVDKNVTITPELTATPDALEAYFVAGRGPFTTAGPQIQAFFFSKYANRSEHRPDLYLELEIASPFTGGNLSAVISSLNLRLDVFDGSEYQTIDPNANYFSIYHNLPRPKSRGRLTLRSGNPHDDPVIDPNFYAVREDVDILIDGFRLMLELVGTPPLKKLGARPLSIPLPGCQRWGLFSDAYFECVLRLYTSPGYHETSTCTMGVGPDAVVDPRLRVHGVKGLRVVDASIMPIVVSANTHAPSMMIGEKGADLIKEDWGVLDACPEQRSRCKEDRRCSREYSEYEEPYECKED